jgi:glycosyltransferase involved in cell wall biosynthesis
MDGKIPLVSVIMSVYNGSQWLKDAIESVIQQTYKNWEFIIIDDDSNDETVDILNQYKSDPRFKIIRNAERKGLTKNLNSSIAISNGEFVARMDADDICMPDRLKKQVTYLNQNSTTQVVCSFIDFIDEHGNPKGVWEDDRKTTSWKKIRSTLPWRSCIGHPTVMFKKEVFAKYSYNETQASSQDWDLWLQLAADNIVIEKLNEPLLLYRVHSKSVTAISLKKTAFFKMNETYSNYLKLVWQKKKFNLFNLKVLTAFLFNKVKLFLSRIKRAFTS